MMMIFKNPNWQDINQDAYNYNLHIKHCKYLTPNKLYQVDESPTMYDPNTFQPLINYIVKCDDGMTRWIDINYFEIIEEYRNRRLDSIIN